MRVLILADSIITSARSVWIVAFVIVVLDAFLLLILIDLAAVGIA